MEKPKENNAEALVQPNLRPEEAQNPSESIMSQTVQTNEKQPEKATSEQNSQDLQETSQKRTTNELEFMTLHSNDYNNFKCPICLDILKNTRVTKSCFHRFCKDCIITSLRVGNKECPVCRRKLISKRSLDTDPQLDELINKIFPGYYEKDSSQQKPLGKRKYKTHQTCGITNKRGQAMTTKISDQHREKQQTKTTRGLESNDSLPCCSHEYTNSSEKAVPSNKRAKTTEFEHDSKHTIVIYDSVTEGASELETSIHQSLRGEDYPAYTELATTSGKWMELENIILSEITQSQNNEHDENAEQQIKDQA